ncbi:MAG: efflux RND transporter periplasmic adaptor subunit [Planctomycetaceae bacterium]|nr:efflux RND transporter periplasmic adaptor subunit [Planctomycetaceae bacterium]
MRFELDMIAGRLTDPQQRRGALLDVLLRQRRIMGAVWYDLRQTDPTELISRLPGPALDRTSLRDWLQAMVGSLDRQGDLRESNCPDIRNLTALCVVVNPGDGAEAVVLLSTTNSTSPPQSELLSLQQLAMAYEAADLRQRTLQEERRTQLSAALLDLCCQLSQSNTVPEACQQLSEQLQQHLGCAMVAVGMIPEHEVAPRLIALSDGLITDPHSTQVQRMEAALAETILAQTPIAFPAFDTALPSPALAHRRLAALHGAEAAVSTPLCNATGEVIGALLCLGDASRLLTKLPQAFLDAASDPLGITLQTVRRNAGGRLARWRRTLKLHATQTRLAVGLIGLILLAAVLALPVPYRIASGCRLEPTTRRLAPAPFEGLLQTTHVAPGDVVTAGQQLATMDGRELEWELAGVIADQQRAEKERDAFQAAHEISKSVMSALEVDRLRARETLLQDRLQRLEIRSPIDGIVLSGSLDRRENVPVSLGQTLYEIAPLDQLRLEVEIPAVEISHAQIGQSVEIRLHGLGNALEPGTIKRIRPTSELRDQRNVFVAEVTIDNRQGRLRPGMQGTAHVVGDHHPLGWNLLHRPWEYLQLHWF